MTAREAAYRSLIRIEKEGRYSNLETDVTLRAVYPAGLRNDRTKADLGLYSCTAVRGNTLSEAGPGGAGDSAPFGLSTALCGPDSFFGGGERRGESLQKIPEIGGLHGQCGFKKAVSGKRTDCFPGAGSRPGVVSFNLLQRFAGAVPSVSFGHGLCRMRPDVGGGERPGGRFHHFAGKYAEALQRGVLQTAGGTGDSL